ncbi:MAG TPA: hypothetical protein VNP20_00675 [Nocardioidaceae bacterium]|nr:hypothetical protein [Nocardioidaceae bacterium]
MTTPGVADPVGATERWFYAHGLPYFVEAHQADVDDALGRGRLLGVLGTALVVAAAAGVGVGLWAGDVSTGVLAGMVTCGAVLVGYALVELRIWPILKWALRRTLGSLRLLFPLVTRALPLLLLFITFLFINAEVWEVTSEMDNALLWVVVLLFSVLAVGFLLVRLPEEVDRVCAEVESSRLADQVRGTPVAESLTRLDLATVEPAPLHGLPRANLLIVLLVAQATQVLVLSLAVFAFFIVFGRLIMTPKVIESWTGQPADTLGNSVLGSVELYQVSVFLAAFAGLYFTVYAVTDQIYRDQFFTYVSHELERAIGVRTVYRALRREQGQDAD